MPCTNAAKTQNPVKFVGVPQTPEPISAISGPKFSILSRHVEEVLVLSKFFFPIVDTCLSCEDSPTKLCDGDSLRAVFSASHVQHVSELHYSKFALRSHHVKKYARHSICDR